MFEGIKLKIEKKKVRKQLVAKKEKLYVRYEVLQNSRKKYLKDNTQYSRENLERVDSDLKKTLKAIYYVDKDLRKLKNVVDNTN